MSHNGVMAKKKANDRHKPSRLIRLKESLAKRLEELADRNATSLTQEANRAVRELLEKNGLWPPAKS